MKAAVITFAFLFLALQARLLAQKNEWGTYLDTLVLIRVPGKEKEGKMQVVTTFRYIDPSNKLWIVKPGYESDGASIPRALWSIAGPPWGAIYQDAAVLHDVACEDHKRPSKEVHRMFYTAMRCSGENEMKAKTMYCAVLLFGPQFPRNSIWDAAKTRYRRLDERDVVIIREWVRTANPTPEQIESLTGGQLPVDARPNVNGGLSYYDPSTRTLIAFSLPEVDSGRQPTGRLLIYSADRRLLLTYSPKQR